MMVNLKKVLSGPAANHIPRIDRILPNPTNMKKGPAGMSIPASFDLHGTSALAWSSERCKDPDTASRILHLRLPEGREGLHLVVHGHQPEAHGHHHGTRQRLHGEKPLRYVIHGGHHGGSGPDDDPSPQLRFFIFIFLSVF